MGDALVALGLVVAGVLTLLGGLAVPSVRRRWRETLGRSVPYRGSGVALRSEGAVREGEDPEYLATALIGRAVVDGRARLRDVVVEVRWDRSVVVAVGGVVTGPHTARVARDVVAEHLRGAA